MTGEIARCHARLQQLSDDLEHVDATIRLFAPDFVQESVLPKVFQPPKSWSKRGEMSRHFSGNRGRFFAVHAIGPFTNATEPS